MDSSSGSSGSARLRLLLICLSNSLIVFSFWGLLPLATALEGAWNSLLSMYLFLRADFGWAIRSISWSVLALVNFFSVLYAVRWPTTMSSRLSLLLVCFICVCRWSSSLIDSWCLLLDDFKLLKSFNLLLPPFFPDIFETSKLFRTSNGSRGLGNYEYPSNLSPRGWYRLSSCYERCKSELGRSTAFFSEASSCLWR